MKSKFNKKPGSVIHLEVEFTPEEFKVYWQEAHDAEATKVHLKGFRPGQAPKDLANKAVDPEKVFDNAANNAVRFSLNELIKENNWTIIDKPQMTVDEHNLGFKYKVDLTVFPEVELGDYKKIAEKSLADFEKVKKEITVSQKEIDDSFEWLKKSGANLEKFKDNEMLKKSIGEGLIIEKEERAKDKQRLKLLEEIVRSSKMDIPQVMIERIKQQGLSEDEAKKNVANHLTIFKIAQQENLNPTPEEVGEGMKRYRELGGPAVDNQKLYDYIYGVIQNKKVLDFLEDKKDDQKK